MKFIEYFTKAKTYFIILISITVLQSLALLFAIYPKFSIDPIGIIKLLIAIYAGFKLKIGFKHSAILGALMFLSIIWYVPIALPGIVFISGNFIIFLTFTITAVINLVIYALAAMLGNLLARIKKSGKK
ncbi:MAG: hypothetical protein WC393_01380 [Candidatus Nanoarchaeia archaeon]|jgi:hypothetical protein